MNRREFIKTAAAVVPSLSLLSTSWAQHSSKKPNVILILTDDLGYGDIPCYGAPDTQTPNIDSLARDGMTFRYFYANSPVCSPTRASILTGRYPDLVGVPGVIRTSKPKQLEQLGGQSWGYLDPNVELLPHVLKKGGYSTAIIGKWHLGLESPNLPNERGFDFFHGFIGDMMDDYWSHLRLGQNYMRLNNETINPNGHATDLFTNWAIDYVKKNKNKSEPFFLYLAYNAPHVPIQPPPEWLDRVKKQHPELSEMRARYVALVEHLDFNIGRFIETLKSTGQMDNTLLIFTSDNGGATGCGALNGNISGGKGGMYEGGLRVPCIATWRNHIKPGADDCSHVLMTMDLFPTICEVAGVKWSGNIDGMSFLPVLTGEHGLNADKYLIWVVRDGWNRGGRAFYAIRHGRWKLLQDDPFSPCYLYDLETDPLEKKPLPQTHKMYGELFEKLTDHINESGKVPWNK